MLTKEDLQAIAAIMDEKILASEERTNKRMIESEERTKRELMMYFENSVSKDIKTIAEGHKGLNEKLDRILDRVEDAENIEPRVVALEIKVKENTADIEELKKAQ